MQKKKLQNFKGFEQDPVIVWGSALAVSLWLISTGALAFYYRQIPPVVPLFYSLVRGADQLAEKPFLAILPFMSLVFLITHVIFAKLNYVQDMVFARIMILSASVGVFIFAVALGHILWIVL